MIIVFCGIPGSGKSTIARILIKKLKELGSYKIFISDKVGGQVYKKISKFLKENLGKVNFILIDATFYKRRWQEMVYKIARNHKILIAYLHCSLKTCLKRNKKREPKIPEKAIYIIHHQMERPKNPDISINTDKIKPNKAALKILDKIKKHLQVYTFDRDGTLIWGNPIGPIKKCHLLKMRKLGYIIGGSGGQEPREQYRNWRENGVEPSFAFKKRNLDTLKTKYEFVVHVGDNEDDKFYAKSFGINYMTPQEFIAWLNKGE